MPADHLIPIEQLPPLSTRLRLHGLSPNTEYTVVVAHLEAAPAQGFTPPRSATFITSAVAGQASAPDDPVPFVFLTPVRKCGIAVFNTEDVPGTVLVVQMATETGVASGSYGAWAEIDRVPTPPMTWMVETVPLPPDGLRRAFQVKATRPAVGDSPFCAGVVLDPSVTLLPTDFPVDVPSDMLIEPVAIVLPSGMTVALTATYTAPTSHQFDHMEYLVEASSDGGKTFAAGLIHAGGSTGSDVILGQASGTYRVTPITVTSGAPTLVLAPGYTITARRHVGSSYIVPVAALGNIPVIVATVDATNVTYAITPDVGTGFIRVYSNTYASDPTGTVDNVENFAFWVADLDPSKTSIALPVTSGLPWRVTTFVAYDRALGRSMAETFIKQRDAGAAVPTAPTVTAATFPGIGGTGSGATGPLHGNWAFPNWVGIKCAFNGTAPTAGDVLTLYRGGLIVGNATIASADIAAGYAIVFDGDNPVAGVTYAYTAKQTTQGAGTSVASAAVNVTVRAGYQLDPPSSLSLSQSAYLQPVFASITNFADGELPPGAVAVVTYITGLGTAAYGGSTGVPPMILLTSSGNANGGSWNIAYAGGYTYVRVRISAPGYIDSTTVGAFILNKQGF